ncbi:MAG: Ig domain-containing protein [Lachnospiraceae bacterium]|nr:Ig domain-containing protein [Lachnospiraceae bacterium]
MKNHQNKLSRALAILMSFAMALSVVFVGNPTEVQAANNKKVASMKVNKASVTLDLAKTKTTTVKVTVNAKKGNKLAKKLFVVKATPKDKSVVKTKIKSQPKGNAKAKKGITKITLTAQKVGKTTITIKAKKNSKVKQVIDVEVIDSSAKPADTQPTQPDQKPADTQPTQPDQKPADTVTTPTAANTEIKLPESIDKTNPVIAINTPVKFDTNQPGLVWKSSNEDVAMITSDGTFFGKKDGKVEVQLVDANGNVIQKMEITVGNGGSESGSSEPTYENVKVTSADTTDGSIPTLAVGTSTKLNADVPEDVAAKITWQSSDPNVAVVDPTTGSVTGIGAGSATVTAYLDGKAIGSVSVKIDVVSVTGVTLEKSAIEMSVGDKTTVKETIAPATATNRGVTWSSDKPDIASVNVSTGEITAIKAGEANVTVTTVDGEKKAVVKVTVKDSTVNDVDSIEASVSNAIEGYPGTVLVGTTAKIDFTVTNDGLPYSGGDAIASLENGNGYAEYYTLVSNMVKLTSEGKGSFYVKLKDEYTQGVNKKTPMIDDIREDGAFASLRLKIQSGGASLDAPVDLRFGQIINKTEHMESIEVTNDHSSILPALEPADCREEVMYSYNKDRYEQEYVPDQQVSSTVLGKDHAVTFDATPMIVLPATLGTEDAAAYVRNLNIEVSEYSVYQDEYDAGWIEGEDETAETKGSWIKDVPGGLNYLTMTLDRFKLSSYTRMVIRAYESNTMNPITDAQGNLVQEVINGGDITINAGNPKDYQIGKEIFNDATKDLTKFDLLVFVESAGQVNEDENLGYKVSKVEGFYENQDVKPFDVIRLVGTVTYTTGAQNHYTPEIDLPDAELYLGESFVSNHTYKYSLPAFPDTGDAIIYEYEDSTLLNLVKRYMYPTETTENNKTVICEPTDGYLIVASVDQVEANKNFTADTTENGTFVVDSQVPGYVHVNANVKVGDVVDYKVKSYVLFSPIPETDEIEAKDVFAIAGQTVTFQVKVNDANGNKKSGANVKWFYGEDPENQTEFSNGDSYVVENGISPITDDNGINKLTVKASVAKDLKLINVVVGNQQYHIEYVKVDDQLINETYCNLHWIAPGIYFKDMVQDGGEEYNTADVMNPTTVTDTYEYEVSKHWLIGTKVSGVPEGWHYIEPEQDPLVPIGDDDDDDDDDDDNDEYAYDYDIVDISNIKIEYSSKSDNNGEAMERVDSETTNGLCTVTRISTGNSTVSAELAGFIDPTKKCVITILENGVEVPYVSVGNLDDYSDDIATGKKLDIKLNWAPFGKKMNLIIPNAKSSIDNGAVVFYIQTTDLFDNVITSQTVDFKVKDANNNVVMDGSQIAVTSDEAVVIGNGEVESVPVGCVAVFVDAPDEAQTYSITANVNGSESVKASSKISFTEPEGEDANFTIESVTPDSTKNEIKVKFTSAVDKALAEGHKLFYVIDDNGKDLSSNIESVEVDKNDNSTIVITIDKTQTFANTVDVEIDSTIEDGGYVYWFTNKEGQFYSERY